MALGLGLRLEYIRGNFNFSDLLRHSPYSDLLSALLAGVPGFEPGLSVLETDVLTVDTIPLREGSAGERVSGAGRSVTSRHPAPET